MLRKTYNLLKKIPLLNRVVARIRAALYGWVLTIVQDNNRPLQQRIDELQQQLDQQKQLEKQLQELKEQQQIAGERTEYVRLELFFELMHRLKNTTTKTSLSESEDLPIIHHQAAWEQAQQQQNIRLNLGCGHQPKAGYLNVDQRALPQVDIQADVLKLPVDANMVKEIYAAHLVEHFTLQQLRQAVLPYWRDCLQANGTLTLVAPNADAMIRAYADQQIDFQQLSTVLMGMQEYDGDFHYALLSPESLSKLLQEAGFQSVEIVEAAKENGLCLEMTITARKPDLS
ncbi:MAG: class I SAM-dependent methyltransferase [bacterium]